MDMDTKHSFFIAKGDKNWSILFLYFHYILILLQIYMLQ